jgi:hypothetical protein
LFRPRIEIGNLPTTEAVDGTEKSIPISDEREGLDEPSSLFCQPLIVFENKCTG